MTGQVNIKQIPAEQVSMELLLIADPSEKSIQTYLKNSLCFVAEKSGKRVGIYVLQSLSSSSFELMNIGVIPEFQGKGIGAALLQHAIETAKEKRAKRLELGTGTFGYQLSFYQKAGFRVVGVERDYFLNHYDEPVFENGLQHKDRLKLAVEF